MGKVEGQDSLIVTNGQEILLTRSVRRISEDWRKFIPYYQNFNCFSWEYQFQFGWKAVPTKRLVTALPAAKSQIPYEQVVMKFRDKNAEKILKKALEGENSHEENFGEIPAGLFDDMVPKTSTALRDDELLKDIGNQQQETPPLMPAVISPLQCHCRVVQKEVNSVQVQLLEEGESPSKKARVEDDKRKKPRHIMRVSVAGEDLYRVDEGLPFGHVCCENFLEEEGIDSKDGLMANGSIPMELWDNNPLDVTQGPQSPIPLVQCRVGTGCPAACCWGCCTKSLLQRCMSLTTWPELAGFFLDVGNHWAPTFHCMVRAFGTEGNRCVVDECVGVPARLLAALAAW